MTMIWPMNAFATVGGLSVWPMTSPLPISFFARRHEDHFVPILQHSRLDPSHRDSPDSGYGVNVLDWNSQWLVERLGRWNDSIQRIKYAGTLVPWSIGALLGEVIS